MRANSVTIELARNTPVSVTTTASCAPRRPVASLMRLSPPMMAVIRRGTLRRARTACTATVSVGDTTAPIRKHTDQSSPGRTSLAAMPAVRIVNATSPIPSERMGRSQRLKSCHDARHASA